MALTPRVNARAATAALTDERGFGLIEVMVSALVLVFVALGVLTGLDAAGNVSGTNKSRGIASSLAQDDQERMRGQEVRTLALAGTTNRTVKVGGVSYTVVSAAETRPDSRTDGCTSGSTGIDYLKLTSTVTWPKMRGTQPVTAESLMAPRPGSFGPNEGALAVRLIDRNGNALPGVGVTISGASTVSDSTDDLGCAFFTYIPSGNYTVSFSLAGYVTPAGVSAVSEAVGVPDGAVSNKVFQYDRAASINATFRSKKAGSSTATNDDSTSLAMGHGNIPAPGALFIPTSPSPSATIAVASKLFPFTSAYTVYSGKCTAANPRGLTPVQPAPTVILAPAGTGSATVIEPAINVVVRRGGNSPTLYAGANLKIYHRGCAERFTLNAITNASGRLANPGFPYGEYNVCADDGTRYQQYGSVVMNKTEAGTADIPIHIKTSGTAPLSPTGRCPN